MKSLYKVIYFIFRLISFITPQMHNIDKKCKLRNDTNAFCIDHKYLESKLIFYNVDF